MTTMSVCVVSMTMAVCRALCTQEGTTLAVQASRMEEVRRQQQLADNTWIMAVAV